MDGEDVFGCKISLSMTDAASASAAAASKRRFATPFPPPPNPALVAPPRLLDFPVVSASAGVRSVVFTAIFDRSLPRTLVH